MVEGSHEVFLSYASQDAGAAQKIAEALRAGGVEVFLDQSELRGGDAWDEKIRGRVPQGAVDALARRETPPEFVARIQKLLSGETGASLKAGRRPAAAAPLTSSARKAAIIPIALVLIAHAGIGAYVLIERPWVAKLAPAATFAPPAHFIAVLPFVNMSGDKEQQYFSDGLTEELLNSLTEIKELQVAARTSAFSFKGTNTDIGTIGRKLNVGAVLEGSVRRSGNTVRITTQLINVVTGYHLWTHTYDHDLGDVLKLETEIANAVAGALKVNLLGDAAAKIELGGTRNPAAFDAYLRAQQAAVRRHDEKDVQTAIEYFTQAVELDSNYALAFAMRSLELSVYASSAAEGELRTSYDKAQADALKAIELAPDLAEGQLALAMYLEQGKLDFPRADQAYERALALAPRNVHILRLAGLFAIKMGRTDAGIAELRRALVLDPLSRRSHQQLGEALYRGRRSQEAIATLESSLVLFPGSALAESQLGLAYYASHDFERARAACEAKADYWQSQVCMAVTYEKLGRHAEAEGQLAKLRAAGDAAAYQYAAVYAQWGDSPKALDWLETALRLRDPGLVSLKSDLLMDPLRQKPRFQAIMRELKFPD